MVQFEPYDFRVVRARPDAPTHKSAADVASCRFRAARGPLVQSPQYLRPRFAPPQLITSLSPNDAPTAT
ncbi:hypothetical protein EVAR_29520_1 [Eumeta japonica]|uniref:Uncharacterized protein n=1 Tax=Eumeta variegata TaxID=151549 RepID=A0A4C1WIE3_EUMVA|nr:hypothetical protein EVAR_29520_1 [Eumeta japonica]